MTAAVVSSTGMVAVSGSRIVHVASIAWGSFGGSPEGRQPWQLQEQSGGWPRSWPLTSSAIPASSNMTRLGRVGSQDLRRVVIDPLLAEHQGRIVKLMGDGALVEFGSVVDAVACAVAIQKG